MRLTFEAVNMRDLVHQLEETLSAIKAEPSSKPAPVMPPAVDIAAVEKKLNEPWPAPKAQPPRVEKRVRSEKQLANDEKLRAAALERIEAKRAARGASDTKATAVEKPVAKPVKKLVEKMVEELAEDLQPKPEPEPEVFADPGEAVRIRQQTIADLQKAYANGHQQEVFELLSRFGNGAKSYRELPPEAFIPIRDAIAKGALT